MGLLPVYPWFRKNFSLELVKACIEKERELKIMACLRRANEGGLANILDYVPKGCYTSSEYIRGQEMHRRRPALQDFPRSLAARIL